MILFLKEKFLSLTPKEDHFIWVETREETQERCALLQAENDITDEERIKE